jgi:hypothetical protein
MADALGVRPLHSVLSLFEAVGEVPTVVAFCLCTTIDPLPSRCLVVPSDSLAASPLSLPRAPPLSPSPLATLPFHFHFHFPLHINYRPLKAVELLEIYPL